MRAKQTPLYARAQLALLVATTCIGVPALSFDFYDPATNQLTIRSGLLGSTVYTNVVLKVAGVTSIAGGPPATERDIYFPSTNQLFIPSVSAYGSIYTNVQITPGAIVSVGGSSAIPALSASIADAPVTGLAYSTSSGYSNTTNGTGQFYFASGDNVTFSVGGITLGTISSPTASQVYTPVNLVQGATGASDATVTAIGQLLAGLNSVSVANGEGNSGVMVMPTSAGLTGSSAATVTSLLNTLQTSGTTTSTLAAALSTGGVLQTAIGAAGGVVPSAASAQANVNSGMNGASLANTIWSAPCSLCANGGPLLMFLSGHGILRAYDTGSTSTGSSVATSFIGTWQASTTAATPTAAIALVGPNGGYLSGSVGNGSGTTQVFQSNGTLVGSLTFTQQPSTGIGASSAYVGAWKGYFNNITAAGAAAGEIPGGSAYIDAEPNGAFFVSEAAASVGSWDPSSGIGTLTAQGSGEPTACNGTAPASSQTVSVDFSKGIVTETLSGTSTVRSTGIVIRTHGTGADMLSRIHDNASTAAAAELEQIGSLSFNVNINWPANDGTHTSAFVLQITTWGPSNVGSGCSSGSTNTKLEADTLRPEINPLGNGATAGSSTDTFAFRYILGQSATYSAAILGPASGKCGITGNGSGTVSDANSGNASAYPTIQVTCQ